ncbi:MAG: hypothetical protein Q9169_002147 [Polycauliona sp. 2 TL-2023]
MDEVLKQYSETAEAPTQSADDSDSETEATKHLQASRYDLGIENSKFMSAEAGPSQTLDSEAYGTSTTSDGTDEDSAKDKENLVHFAEPGDESEEIDDEQRGRNRTRTHRASVAKKSDEPATEVVASIPLTSISKPDQDPTKLQMPAASDHGGNDIESERSQVPPVETGCAIVESPERKDSGVYVD